MTEATTRRFVAMIGGNVLGLICALLIGLSIWPEAPFGAIAGLLLASGFLGAALMGVIVHVMDAA